MKRAKAKTPSGHATCGSPDVAERWLLLRREAEQLAGPEEVQQDRDQVVVAQTLQRLSVALTLSLELEDVLCYVLDELARLVPYDSATVMLLEDGVLRLHAQRGFDWDANDGVLESRCVRALRYGGHGRSLLKVTAPSSFPTCAAVPAGSGCPARRTFGAGWACPCRVQGRVIGMFSIDKAEPNFFNERHVSLAAALAPHAAIAIERARLIQDLRAPRRCSSAGCRPG